MSTASSGRAYIHLVAAPALDPAPLERPTAAQAGEGQGSIPAPPPARHAAGTASALGPADLAHERHADTSSAASTALMVRHHETDGLRPRRDETAREVGAWVGLAARRASSAVSSSLVLTDRCRAGPRRSQRGPAQVEEPVQVPTPHRYVPSGQAG